MVIPDDLREAFSDAGKRLPDLWPGISGGSGVAAAHAVSGVNVFRHPDGLVPLRMVWRGGLVTERQVRVPVSSIRFSETEKKVADRIRSLTTEGFENQAIARN